MKRLIFTLTFLVLPLAFIQAQTSITFNVDLRSMMKDSTFVPVKDVIRVNGNLYPLGPNRAVQLRPDRSQDSVYTAEVNFSRRYNDERLRFNYEIVKPEETISERGPRSVVLRGQDVILPPVSFNSFVQ